MTAEAPSSAEPVAAAPQPDEGADEGAGERADEQADEQAPALEAAPLGAAFAYEAVAQAAAIAVQDAATYLRQVGMLSAAAIAVCTTKMMETKDPEPWISLIERANASVSSASRVFAEVGENAARVLKAFSK